MTLARRAAVLLGAAVLCASVRAPVAAAPGQAIDPSDVAAIAIRQACSVEWVAGVCDPFAYPDPGYVPSGDAAPASPYGLRIGAVHEHSGYSDGDPHTRPSDYFTAGRTGHNTADAGGDTGVVLDYMLSSEHSENEKLPITTAEVCLDPTALAALASGDVQAACLNVDGADHHRKWEETLAQAREATTEEFTALRGYEYTNDYYNHLGVYFARNVVNAKVDGSYLDLEAFWSWLRRPSEKGGGDDALVVFNHPGQLPALTPFDGDTPLNELLQMIKGGGNWDDLAYVPDADDRVMGIEVNGGDDLDWYVKALRNGWHLGPVAAEDEHQQEWSTSDDGKTVVLTRGAAPQDHYVAFAESRTMALGKEVVDGEPGTAARYPSLLFWADGTSVDDPTATVLGGTVAPGSGPHQLELDARDLPPGAQAVLLSDAFDGPRPIGTADSAGSLRASVPVTAPSDGADWWFVTVCLPDVPSCGTAGSHVIVTAPIWVQAAAADAPVAAAIAGAAPPVGAGRTLPATGGREQASVAVVALAAGLALLVVRRRAAAPTR